MEALIETSYNAELFLHINLVYLHCRTIFREIEVLVLGLPFLLLNLLYCHFSFVNSLAEDEYVWCLSLILTLGEKSLTDS